MVEQILPNNNEKCYSNFSPKFSQLNTALINNDIMPEASGCLLILKFTAFVEPYCSSARALHATWAH
jgi:hypothetical protein